VRALSASRASEIPSGVRWTLLQVLEAATQKAARKLAKHGRWMSDGGDALRAW
ncbi:unnamed protein product, partial [Amoebophrya sp. A120]